MKYDAIIIGSGHNGLVTGIYLAKAGWKVVILERNSRHGGAIQTAEITLPGFHHDLYATNLSLFAGSPFYQEFKTELEQHGLAFAHAEHTFSSVFPDDSYLGVHTELEKTLAVIRLVCADDAETWQSLFEQFPSIAERLFPLMAERMPSLGLARQLLRNIRSAGFKSLLDTFRLLVSSPREFASTHFTDEKLHALVCAWGMHLDFSPDISGGGLFAYLESMTNQSFGMFLGKGGADTLSNALAGVFRQYGGELRLQSEVTEITIHHGKAEGVILSDNESIRAKRSVIGNLTPTILFGRLIKKGVLSTSFMHKVDNYQYGPGTMMIHLAMQDLPNWKASEDLKKFAYVHIAPYLQEMSQTYTEAVNGLLPADPFLIVAQPTAIDPGRAPHGKHILSVQVRVLPSTIKGDALQEITECDWQQVKQHYADRVIKKIGRYAPDIHEKILARAVLSPDDLEHANPNLTGGDNISGSMHLRQNYLFRPFPGWSNYKTPVKNLYMVGAATWPGAGTGAGSGRLLGKMLT